MPSFADFVNFLGPFVRAADGTWRSHSRRARALGRGDLRGPHGQPVDHHARSVAKLAITHDLLVLKRCN